MKNVYFKALDSFDNQTISEAAATLLAQFVEAEAVNVSAELPIKVHFGEKGNQTFVPAACYNGVIDYLASKDIASRYIETNVLYRGQRTTRDNHIAVAIEHGFTQIPIIIADGERGEAAYPVVINKHYFDQCSYGKAFDEYDQVLVCSHFKGHEMAGFGGAIKQLAMGFASRGGKMAQHAKLVPAVNPETCVSCGLCLEACDVGAIDIDAFARISETRCIGCAGCIAVCPVGAIKNDWGAENFIEKLTEYAYGAQLGKSFIYLNFLMNITDKCDCVGQAMQTVADDIGLLISSDPVAIDKACYDLLAEQKGEAMFSKGFTQFSYAKTIDFGDSDYTLITC